MMLIAGILFLLLGLASGVLLVLAPLGWSPLTPGPTTWVLFPLLTVLGYVFVVVAARTRAVPAISRVTGALLLALAVAATVELFLIANAVVPSPSSMLPLWYVLGIGLVLGTAGLAIRRYDGSPP